MTVRPRLAVVPVALAAIVLAGCQDEAPTALPPQPSSTSPVAGTPTAAPSDPAAAPTSAPTEQPAATVTVTATPTPTAAAPATPPAAGTSSGVCASTSTYEGRPGPAATPIATKQTFTDNGGSVEMTVGRPTIDRTSTGSTYYPGEGMVSAVFPVTLKNTSASYFITSSLKFTLVDGQQRPCKRDTLNYAVPDSQQLDVDSLHAGDSVSAKLVFAVPQGADLSGYQVLFTDNYPGVADLAWKAS
ncbi:DUF4352 domain-containing protein [Luteipulveratus halotolerans]|uniref:DUF4352 domain-containing protein n=1 Tax=Luteipulveratus halotolerans TaxID=1631356 RepID=A0A0L6CH70_9MICO|nr:DUF4352 domain-containing protein [Luteipulveratus halotolerans]KNX36863.1 hypothetical protein VV01_06405 [Luteipulveratus halotolerans]